MRQDLEALPLCICAKADIIIFIPGDFFTKQNALTWDQSDILFTFKLKNNVKGLLQGGSVYCSLLQ